MSNDNIIDFGSRKTPEKKGPEPVEAEYEFHAYTSVDEGVSIPVKARGYLKFGPAFMAVADGPEDNANIKFAIQTNLVKYVRRIEAGEAQPEPKKKKKVATATP